MKEYDLPILVLNAPRIIYDERDSGLYLLGAESPLAIITIEEKPEGYAMLTVPNFCDVANDPDFVAAGPTDIIIQNAVGSLVKAQEATRRIAGIRDMMPETGYYVISASENPVFGELSAQTIRTACQKQLFTPIKEQPIVCEQVNGLLQSCVVLVYRK